MISIFRKIHPTFIIAFALIVLSFFMLLASQADAQKVSQPIAELDKYEDPTIVYVRFSQNDVRALKRNTKISQLPEIVRSEVKPRQVKDFKESFEKLDTKARNNLDNNISRWFTFDFRTVEQAEEFYAKMENNPAVEAVARDDKMQFYVYPQDEFYQPDSPESLWGLDLMNAQELWDVVENPGEGVVVGLVDSGFSNTGNPNDELTHQDLVGSEWINTDEILGNGIDDDGNGYVDDRFGASAVNQMFYQDINGHGTHVGGTIAARSNDIGIPGVAFDATIMPFKTASSIGGTFTPQNGADGIVYAAQNGASVINNSWGGSKNPTIDDAVEYAFANDVLVVSAAGNDSGRNVCRQSPPGSEYSVAVSAVNKDGNLAYYTNRGTGIDVAAPGGGTGTGSQNDILSVRTKSPNPGIDVPYVTDAEGNQYISINGTSMASPHAAAAAAIIRQQRPDWSVEEVWAGLKFIAVEPAGAEFHEGYGHGILDLSRILELPETLPVGQMYGPENCWSSSQIEPVTIVGSAYVDGADTPDSVRIEVASGADVTDEDFTLITTLSGEFYNEEMYTWDPTGYDYGVYTLRVLVEHDGVVTEDRNMISFAIYDFKTALRSEFMHMLGFESMATPNPSSSLATVLETKTYYDRFLKEYDEQTGEYNELFDYPSGEFNGSINFPAPSSSFRGNNVWYQGFFETSEARYEGELLPVFSPSFFSQGSSLRRLDNSRTDEVYLMHPSIGIGEQRFVHPHEKEVLCQLGYQVQGAENPLCELPIPIAVDDFETFGPTQPDACQYLTDNDMFLGADALNLRLFDFSYDVSDPEIDAVQFFNGADIATGSPCGQNQSSFAFNSIGPRIIFNLLNNLTTSKFTRYRAMAPNGWTDEVRVSQEGRAVFWLCENPYNYVCNGDFEKGWSLDDIILRDTPTTQTSGLLDRLVADSWASFRTADLYVLGGSDDGYSIPSPWWGQDPVQELSFEVDPYNTRYAGFVNNQNIPGSDYYREVIFTQLGKPLDLGLEYNISFEVQSALMSPSFLEYSNPNYGEHYLYVGLSSETLSLSDILSPDGIIEESFDQIIFAGNIDDYAQQGDWAQIEVPITPNMEGLRHLYIAGHSIPNDPEFLFEEDASYTRYFLVDNIEIEPQLPLRDLRVEKEILTSTDVSVDDEIVFEITVTNDGDQPIEEVEVRDYYPFGFIISYVNTPNGEQYIQVDQESFLYIEDIMLQPGEAFTFTIEGSMAVCTPRFRNVALAYSENYLDETPENNFIDVFAQEFPFNGEIDNYDGYAEGQMGCNGLIEGFVYYDQNENGERDYDDTGLPGYEIGLYYEENGGYVLEQTTLSDASPAGRYQFSPENEGQYAVVIYPQSMNITFPPESFTLIDGYAYYYEISMGVNSLQSNRDFGMYEPPISGNTATISGNVFEDEDQDGIFDNGESPANGYLVNLYEEANNTYTLVDQTQVLNDGSYAFDVDALGGYVVLLDSSNNTDSYTVPGYTSTPVQNNNHYYAVEVSGYANYQGHDFGLFFCPCGNLDVDGNCFVNVADLSEIISNYGNGGAYCDQYGCPGDVNGDNIVDHLDSIGVLTVYACPVSNPEYAIAGYVYYDGDGDGRFDIPDTSDDAYVDGYTVNLYRLENNQWQFVDQQVSAPDEYTQGSGVYMFEPSQPGEYAIVLDEQHQGEALSQPVSGSTTLENSSYVHFATLGVGENNTDYNNHFGLLDEPELPVPSVSGVVYYDENENGQRDAGEIGLSGFEIVILDLTTQVLGSTTSDAEGMYTIELSEGFNFVLAITPGEAIDAVTEPVGFTQFGGYSNLYFIDGTLAVQQPRNFGLLVSDIPEPCSCIGQVVGEECLVDSEDTAAIQANYGCVGPDCLGDVNGDGRVNTFDMVMTLPYVGCPAYSWLQGSPNLLPDIETDSGDTIDVQNNYFTTMQTLDGYEYNYQIIVENITSGVLENVVIDDVVPIGFSLQIVDALSTVGGVQVEDSTNQIIIEELDPGEQAMLYLTVEQL